MDRRLLVVDDDRIILESLSEYLRSEGFETDAARDYYQAVDLLNQNSYAVVITDINIPQVDGLELLRHCREEHPDTIVVLITGYGTVESAVEAIKMGAYDYVTKPIIDEEIRIIIERAMARHQLVEVNKTLRDQLDMRFGLNSVVGHDYQMLKVFDLVQAVADTRTTVLITGESGTGKTLVGRAVHRLSGRRDGPFVEVSCGALPETLLESELFGHIEGSFTGAVRDKVGKFEQADGGTIFLDEISTASPALQVKLLRILQDMEFEPVGGTETRKVDARVILATNKDLAQEVAAGTFRQDLYYRINVMPIPMPPLRDRIGDIPLLAEHFLTKYCQQNSKMIGGISEEAVTALQQYPWPGNVRELENVIERAVVLSRQDTIRPDDLPPTLLEQQLPTYQDNGTAPLRQALEEPERRIIERALKAHSWNRQLTAQALDINRTTLYKKMKKYRLELEYEALTT